MLAPLFLFTFLNFIYLRTSFLWLCGVSVAVVVAPLAVAHGPSGAWASAVVMLRLSCSAARGLFLGQGLNPLANASACISRQIFNHQTTRETTASLVFWTSCSGWKRGTPGLGRAIPFWVADFSSLLSALEREA